MTEDVRELLARVVADMGGETRAGQSAMADKVSRALHDDSCALIQAGTGTGKSLGYLVPAVAYAVQNNARVVLSTATLALQRQVITEDLPRVVESLHSSLGHRPRVGLLKGRAHYVCRHKLAGGYPSEEESELPGVAEQAARGPRSDLGREVARLHEWAQDSDTGDRDDLIPGVSDRAWKGVSVSGAECLGGTCPVISQCFAEKAREEAKRAHIVVTNHAMLGIHAIGHDVLGEYDAVIVDEAHELVSRITTAATVELTVPGVQRTVRRARACNVDTAALDQAVRDFDDALLQCEVGRIVGQLPEELASRIEAIRTCARETLSLIVEQDSGEGSQGTLATAALEEVITVADYILGASTGGVVVWLAPEAGDYDSSIPYRVVAAPLDVAGLVHDRLLSHTSAVMTSATLSLGGGFDVISRQLGVDQAETYDAGTPFDYGAQGILYIAGHLPRPTTGGISGEALAEMEELIRAAEGRTLGLFSSHRAAQSAVEYMRTHLDVPVLYQKDDQLPTLVAQFREDPHACLFGSTALWQGIDVPGSTLSLVVIDRIPFPRPDDPIVAARTEAADRDGNNGFMSVSAAHVALLLAQGAGRLIRSHEDRGVVAVLDSRLAHARYASFLTAGMPGFWATQEPVVAREALQRLTSEAGEPTGA